MPATVATTGVGRARPCAAQLASFTLNSSSAVLQAKGRTGEAIGRLCQLAPATALLLEGGDGASPGGEREVPTALLHRGDLIKVHRGAVAFLRLGAGSGRLVWRHESMRVHRQLAGHSLWASVFGSLPD